MSERPDPVTRDSMTQVNRPDRSQINRDIHNVPLSPESREWHLARPHGGYNSLVFWKELNEVARISKLDSASSMLIVGGGNGVEANFFARKRPALWTVNSDISFQFCELSLELQMRSGTRFPNVTLNAENIPFKDRSFDVVFCNGAFHHMERQGLAVAEMCRVARAIVAFGSEPVLSVSRRLARRLRAEGVEYDGFRPYAPRPRELRRLFSQAGFRQFYFSGRFNPTLFPSSVRARFDSPRGAAFQLILLNVISFFIGWLGPTALFAFRRIVSP